MSTKKKKQKLEKSKTTKSGQKKNPTGKRMEIEAELPLTNAEKVKRGEEACLLFAERDRLMLERKEVMNEFAARIKSSDARGTSLLKEFETGREVRKVTAIEHKNFDRGVIEYWYNGEKIKERDMEASDRQEDLPLKGGKVENPPVVNAEQKTLPLTEDKACVTGKEAAARTKAGHHRSRSDVPPSLRLKRIAGQRTVRLTGPGPEDQWLLFVFFHNSLLPFL
jgi:hypothetical protein